MLGLRTAGEALGRMDDAYAKSIRELGPKQPETEVGQLGKVLANLYGIDRKGTLFNQQDPRYNPLQDDLGKAILVSGRYAIPAAGLGGLTLAGKALLELTQDYQSSGTLRP